MMGDVFLQGLSEKRKLNKVIVAITVTTIILGLVLPEVWIKDLLTPFAILLILLGIPHGATDFVIFQRIFSKNKITQQLVYFGVGYITIILLYIGIWYTNPFVAFLLFILNSIYHFGESNWNYLEVKVGGKAALIYMAWGGAILGVPILLHFEQASNIIQEITGVQLVLSTTTRAALVYLLCFCNLAMITTIFDAGSLTQKQFYREIRHFTLLVLLFFCTPLLIGFSVYFVFWHSLYAMKDQFKYLDLAKNSQRKKTFFKQLFLNSIVAFLVVGGLYLLAHDYMNQGYNLGKLFVFIAVVTVPHSLLMHNLYQFKVFQEKNEKV